jgi:hypothetical protein
MHTLSGTGMTCGSRLTVLNSGRVRNCVPSRRACWQHGNALEGDSAPRRRQIATAVAAPPAPAVTEATIPEEADLYDVVDSQDAKAASLDEPDPREEFKRLGVDERLTVRMPLLRDPTDSL